MTEYHVVWRIEVEADTSAEAALQARAILLDPETEATVFEVAEFSDWHANSHNADFQTIDLYGVDFDFLQEEHGWPYLNYKGIPSGGGDE